jgi:hypothetical protein
MNADSERAFDELSLATGKALWPGRIRLDGVEYDCCLVRRTYSVRWGEGDSAGLREVDGIAVELGKDVCPTAPVVESLVQDLADSRLYRLKQLGGRGVTDASWYLECVTDDRS